MGVDGSVARVGGGIRMQGSTPITDWKALIRKWETMPHSRDKPAQAGGSSIDTADLDALMRRGAS